MIGAIAGDMIGARFERYLIRRSDDLCAGENIRKGEKFYNNFTKGENPWLLKYYPLKNCKNV